VTILNDPRVRLHPGVSDASYEVHTDGGVWDVVELAGEQQWAVVSPAVRHWDVPVWVAGLPRFSTPVAAVERVFAVNAIVADGFVAAREWCPRPGERVVDDRPAYRGGVGLVELVEANGNVGDPWFVVAVRWGSGRVEGGVPSHWLFRLDGSQGPR
jgi:hypothetical protein